MAESLIQANYRQLEEIAKQFQSQAHLATGMLDRVTRAFDLLTDGGWRGSSAAAFFDEMDGHTFPGIRRLIDALKTAEETTLAVKKLIRDAEVEAAMRCLYEGGAGDGTKGEGGGSSSSTNGGDAGKGKSFSTVLIKKFIGKGLTLFRNRNLLNAFSKGLRFVKDVDGVWQILGSDAAKKALGVSPSLTRLSKEAIKKINEPFGLLKNIRGLVSVKDGPLAKRAANLLNSIKNAAPLESVAGFTSKLKGTSAVTLLLDIYDFTLGDNKDKGLLSRQFITATTADLIAGAGIAAASTAIGTVLFPGVGTAAGFAIGMGIDLALSVGYDILLKDDWRGTVDNAAQYVQEQASHAPEQISRISRDISYAAQDTANQIGRQAAQIGDQFQRTVNQASQVFSGALSGVGQFATGLF